MYCHHLCFGGSVSVMRFVMSCIYFCFGRSSVGSVMLQFILLSGSVWEFPVISLVARYLHVG